MPTKVEQPISVKMVQAKKGEIIRSISLPAVVNANQQATLYAKVAGYLKSISVDKGDSVKQGDLIAEIEVPELQAEMERYKAEQQVAALDYQRANEAQKKAPDLIPLQTIDTARGKSDMAKANLLRAETLLGFTKIHAPFAGTITRRLVDPGAFVPAATSGSAAQNAALVTLADFKTVRVQVAIPENEVPLTKPGLPVRVTLEELPDKTFEGTISRSSKALDPATRTMMVEIDLENATELLRPGMYATAKIGIEKHTEVTLLPADAVVFEKSGISVFEVAENKAKKIPVKTGFNDGNFIEIRSGVAVGQSVISAGKITLNNGQPITIGEAK
jgi:membrane fusion protein (multidrug efflux system)